MGCAGVETQWKDRPEGFYSQGILQFSHMWSVIADTPKIMEGFVEAWLSFRGLEDFFDSESVRVVWPTY